MERESQRNHSFVGQSQNEVARSFSWVSQPRKRRRRGAGILPILALLPISPVASMRVARSWTGKPWCESVADPEWPTAYSKFANQTLEDKGRVSTNLQDLRHRCDRRGVASKCHICEQIACGDSLDDSCEEQLQGVNTTEMSVNVPTVSDTPWAVGGAHRNDFGNSSTTRVCQMLSGGHCISPFGVDYSNCSVRCWGHNFTGADAVAEHFPGSRSYNAWEDNDHLADRRIWEYKATDIWGYPKQKASSFDTSGAPEFNPQGYVFTLAGGGGHGAGGYADGVGAAARFREPHDVAVDREFNVYVADTGNNRIRKITPGGVVTTVAGSGEEGYEDGLLLAASFSSPTGVALYYDESDEVVLLVADRGNHRIRRLQPDLARAEVTCWAGRCGNGTESWALARVAATPQPGYADGDGDYARFDSPSGVAAEDDGTVYVADTNNHLLRVIMPNRTVYTLAGATDRAQWQPLDGINGGGSRNPEERPEDGSADVSSAVEDGNGYEPFAGCPPPCLAGVAGHVDGNLTEARFTFPSDVELGPNRTLLVTELHTVRLITLPGAPSTIGGLESEGRVVTLAGTAEEGQLDGRGAESRFDRPLGITATPDGRAYAVDSASCAVRRLTPAALVAQNISCTAALTDVLRPSGCSSYDPPVDARNRAATPVSGNIYYNHAYRDEPADPIDGWEVVGRAVKQCVGTPPPDRLRKEFLWGSGLNLVVDEYFTEIKEDTGDGTTIKLSCPAGCGSGYAAPVRGSWNVTGGYGGGYTDDSSVCRAAIHAGAITDIAGGLIDVTLLHGNASLAPAGSVAHGVTAGDGPTGWARLFKVESYPEWAVEVQTISGAPAAQLQDGCRFGGDGQPPQEASFSSPSGVDAYRHRNLTDAVFLYVADTGNHVVRVLSAVCSFPCENGGRCVGPDECQCPDGWGGIDCSVPVCSQACGDREVCVGSNECACIPGYGGTSCDVPLCEQDCGNHGDCAAPDTCSCDWGWFDANCTTPVCPQTCGNGGNCTAPATCTCASDWTGTDCRTPVCAQSCFNGGWCTAPDTCTCPPAWTGHDCSLPICTQGYFVPGMNITSYHAEDDSARPNHWAQYMPCRAAEWCNATNGFDCRQPGRRPWQLVPPDGGREETGRRNSTDGEALGCFLAELPPGWLTPYPYLTERGAATAYARYSPPRSYGWLSWPSREPWNAYNGTTDGRTLPWSVASDRQVALMERYNVTQGHYVCANGGNCTAPGVCACAEGWAGFDCRTPICRQGYWLEAQDSFVSGSKSASEVANFEAFLDPRAVRLDWPYSNPNFTVEAENYTSAFRVARTNASAGGEQYLWRYVNSWGSTQQQGGYRCSVRAHTVWENEDAVENHPEYYSEYNSDEYEWAAGMGWPAVTAKTKAFVHEDNYGNIFVYTDRGYMRDGYWNTTGTAWTAGNCIVEFSRYCGVGDVNATANSANAAEAAQAAGFGGHVGLFGLYGGGEKNSKAFDLLSLQSGVRVQDTDASYRPQVLYNDWMEWDPYNSRWEQEGGECVDRVKRGCYNNGTCVAPDLCACNGNWTGTDCSQPVCGHVCLHNGNCTLAATNVTSGRCTCEKGWSGHDCSVPVCAQECHNGGECVAPDTCQCRQWASDQTDESFDDGRAGGGRPLYRKPNGDAQSTGWTGFDCSVPICVQAESFLLVASSGVTDLGGHGANGTLGCNTVRCPQYDKPYQSNDGLTFQGGCGYDPMDTNCCYYIEDDEMWICKYCSHETIKDHTYQCDGEVRTVNYTDANVDNIRTRFQDDGVIKMCGPDLSPVPYSVKETGRRFLCEVSTWEQGDFIDDAGLGDASGVNSDFGLEAGRHYRINYPNYYQDPAGSDTWVAGDVVRGEGIYACYNDGSCIAPDVCSCNDGWDGLDCNTPLCRHLQPDGTVSGCQHGSICVDKDDCDCVRAASVLHDVYPEAPPGQTGWTGSDCSMPICVQAIFDPHCSDLPQAPGGEGCYRCPNGGNCTAPDVCSCAEGWTGYDCRTPVCEVVADALTRLALDTVDEAKVTGTLDEDKVAGFESDPCAMTGLYAAVEHDNAFYTRGNCTAPNQCTCMCWESYDALTCAASSSHCEGPWQDPLVKYRDLLPATGMFGTRSCYKGYEGLMDDADRYTTCHLNIYTPNWLEYHSVGLIVGCTLGGFFGSIIYLLIRRRLKRKFRLAKIERRRSRRSSEMSDGALDTAAYGMS